MALILCQCLSDYSQGQAKANRRAAGRKLVLHTLQSISYTGSSAKPFLLTCAHKHALQTRKGIGEAVLPVHDGFLLGHFPSAHSEHGGGHHGHPDGHRGHEDDECDDYGGARGVSAAQQGSEDDDYPNDCHGSDGQADPGKDLCAGMLSGSPTSALPFRTLICTFPIPLTRRGLAEGTAMAPSHNRSVEDALSE